MSISASNLQLLATTIRVLSADTVEKAQSGHPGLPMGSADIAAVLWAKHLRFQPQDPQWPGRDRFVLSAGHGSALLYVLLHLFGFEVSIDELKNFRQWGSITPGHPEFQLTPGVETTTGPLGQGFANGVGFALSEKMLADRYSKQLFGNRVVGLVSDGDLMEGISTEAASVAGHLALSNLTYIYDDNNISIGGSTDVCFTEDVAKKFEALGWFVQKCDGHDFEQIDLCLTKAFQQQERPSLICAKTTIGKGSPSKAGDAGVHGAPLGNEELEATRKALDWSLPPFELPEEIRKLCANVLETKKQEYQSWLTSFEDWKSKNPAQARGYESQSTRNTPINIAKDLIEALPQAKAEATRNLSGSCLQVLAKRIPFLIGGSADLEPSNKSLIKDSTDITPEDFSGRNIRYGVREHAMGAIANGLAYTRSWIPYTATFLVFSDYMRPTIRLAALSHLQSLFIFTHDSFYVGEDGPTHQPIEQIWSLRLIPNLLVFRPADMMETAVAYSLALKKKDGPSCLLFTRQNLPVIKRAEDFDPELIAEGAYIVRDSENAEVTLVATGSEVGLALETANILEKDRGLSTRVVSMPCVELYEKLPQSRKDALIPSDSKVVTLEAGSTLGWKGLFGKNSLQIGIDHFGASAPAEKLAEEFGFTSASTVEKIMKFVSSSS